MKALTGLLFLCTTSIASAYAHDGIYKIYAKPYAERCEARADKAGVSRPNEQTLINNCLHEYIIRVARANVNEAAEYGESSGRGQQAVKDAREELAKAFRMYDDDVFTDPRTDEASRGSKAQKRLEIELGRYIDQKKIMENQPSLMNDDD